MLKPFVLALLASASAAVSAARDGAIPQPRIVGGAVVPNSATTFPFYALIQVRSNSDGGVASCGGTLISPTAVVTAAHCFKSNGGGAVFLGLVSPTRFGQAITFSATDVATHPSYVPGSGKFDLAVVTLNTPARAIYTPARLETGGQDGAGGAGMAVGFGYTKPLEADAEPVAGGAAPALMGANISVVDPTLCETRWGALFDRRTHLCGGSWTAQTDACVGDSGGPLMLHAATPAPWDYRSVAGAVSFGAGCAQYGTYSVYTRLSAFSAWLRSRVPNMPGASTLPARAQNPPPGSSQCTYALTKATQFVPTPATVLNCGQYTISRITSAQFVGATVSCNATRPQGTAVACPALTADVAGDCVGLKFCEYAVAAGCAAAGSLRVVYDCSSAGSG